MCTRARCEGAQQLLLSPALCLLNSGLVAKGCGMVLDFGVNATRGHRYPIDEGAEVALEAAEEYFAAAGAGAGSSSSTGDGGGSGNRSGGVRTVSFVLFEAATVRAWLGAAQARGMRLVDARVHGTDHGIHHAAVAAGATVAGSAAHAPAAKPASVSAPNMADGGGGGGGGSGGGGVERIVSQVFVKTRSGKALAVDIEAGDDAGAVARKVARATEQANQQALASSSSSSSGSGSDKSSGSSGSNGNVSGSGGGGAVTGRGAFMWQVAAQRSKEARLAAQASLAAVADAALSARP